MKKATNIKILEILTIAIGYTTQYKALNINKPDVLFIISAFEVKFAAIIKDIQEGKFNYKTFREEMYNFDDLITYCTESLPFVIDDIDENSNSIYDVMYSVLQGIDALIEDEMSDSFTPSKNSNVVSFEPRKE